MSSSAFVRNNVWIADWFHKGDPTAEAGGGVLTEGRNAQTAVCVLWLHGGWESGS